MKTFATLLASAAVALALGAGGIARASGGHHGGHGSHGGGHHGGGHSYGHHDGGHHYGSHHYGGHHGLLSLGWLGYSGYRSYYPSYYPAAYRYGYARPSYRGRVAYGNARSLGAEVQIELARLGYYRGAIDGIVGSGTRRALRHFQADARLPITGRMDRVTVAELRGG